MTDEESMLDEIEEEESGGVPIRERYGLALMLLLVQYVLSGFDLGPIVLIISSVIWVAVLLAILWSPGLPRRLRQIGLGAIFTMLLLSVVLGLIQTDVAGGLWFILIAVAQLAAILAILNRVLRHSTVGFQTVMGGVAAYALIAFAMASVYHSGDLLSNTTFLNGAVNAGDYTYFSFVTLTTVGYGDITAATQVAKRLVVVEAFVGQVFIITLVARLVSLWGKPLRS